MDDVVIRQDTIGTGQRDAAAGGADAEVARLIMELRSARGLSKADLAKRSGLDPSTITRFEQGSRTPDREMIAKLADAMVLPSHDRDRLLAAAGLRSIVWDDPDLIALANVLGDPALPHSEREAIRNVVRFAISHAMLSRRYTP
jgi:transcriptional regulator with XRE-family HTH domain